PAQTRGLSQDLCSSLVPCLLSSAAARVGRWRGRRIAKLLCASRPARAASPAARRVSNGGCQRQLVILRRVVFLCFGGSGVLCVRGSPAGRDAGGTGSG